MVETTESGWAIRQSSYSYFDMNGIGDWSLAGKPDTASLFDTVEEAAQTVRDYDLEADECELVFITRAVRYTVGESVPVPPDPADAEELGEYPQPAHPDCNIAKGDSVAA